MFSRNGRSVLAWNRTIRACAGTRRRPSPDAAGKAGVVGITKTLAKEWGQFKINVNAVSFGFVETRLTAAKEEGGEITSPTGEKIALGIPEQSRAMSATVIPLGRGATPTEAAGPVLFLASPLANYVHGQVLNVTGGMPGGMYT